MTIVFATSNYIVAILLCEI